MEKRTDRIKPYVVIATHAVKTKSGDVYGPAHLVRDFCRRHRIFYRFITYPLQGNLGGKFLEIFKTVFKLRKTKSKIDTFIGVDPLNALAGYILKKQHKVKTLIFYTADYSSKRFPNPFLNFLYHFLDGFLVKRADFVWNISSRITRQRRKMGLKDNKNIFIPPSPPFSADRLRKVPNKPRKLVMVANLTKALDMELIFEAVRILKKDIPDLKLVIVGDGPQREFLEKQAQNKGIFKQLEFLGYRSHVQTLDIISKCDIGLAIYSGKAPWTYFGDSMKAREYLAFGLPVIISHQPSTASEIKEEKAGIVIEPNTGELTAVLEEMLTQRHSYLNYRQGAIYLAQKYDNNRLLEKFLLSLIS